MKILLFIVLLLVCGNSISQNYKITYLRSSNGTLIDGQDPILVYTNESLTRVISKSIDENRSTYPSEFFNLERRTNTFIQIADLNEKSTIYSKDTLSLSKQTFEF